MRCDDRHRAPAEGARSPVVRRPHAEGRPPPQDRPARRAARQDSGVTNLSLQDFGGGLTQLMSLRVEDVSGRQWDRIAYSVTELKHESIAFLCRDVSIPARYALGVGTSPGA